MLAVLFFSTILSTALNRPSLRTPPFPVVYQTPKHHNFALQNMSRPDNSMPPFIYGTAWKKERTKDLVMMAINLGFRGIDTACQPKHYYEPGVGEALSELYEQGVISRSDIFLQTKFTSLTGQDPNNVPYNVDAPLATQVQESFAKSQQNLRTDYVDSLVLHGPMPRFADTMSIWRAMEDIYDRGGTRRLGISNTYDLAVLRRLYSEARVKPVVLQNRFYETSGYDEDIREFCREHSIAYQSFWTLTANPHILKT